MYKLTLVSYFVLWCGSWMWRTLWSRVLRVRALTQSFRLRFSIYHLYLILLVSHTSCPCHTNNVGGILNQLVCELLLLLQITIPQIIALYVVGKLQIFLFRRTIQLYAVDAQCFHRGSCASVSFYSASRSLFRHGYNFFFMKSATYRELSRRHWYRRMDF